MGLTHTVEIKIIYTIVVKWNSLKERYKYGDLDADGNTVLKLDVSMVLQRKPDSTTRGCDQICCFTYDADAAVSIKVMKILTSLATAVFSFPAPWIPIMGLRLKSWEHIKINATLTGNLCSGANELERLQSACA